MIKDFLSGIRQFFKFNKKETYGFVFLSTFTIIVMLAPFFINLNYAHREVVTESDLKKLDSLVNLLNQRNQPAYFEFDPNVISKDSIYLLGITPLVTNNWIKYRNAGGKFEVKKDLAEVYGFDQNIFDTLKYYIKLPEAEKPSYEKAYQLPKFDINVASKEDLKKIYGIGDKLSERIIKYRNLLGGYIDEDQYEDIYYLEGKALQQLKEQTYISKNFIPEKVRINKDAFRSLVRHPYIDEELTDRVLKYRKMNNSYLEEDKFKMMLEDTSRYSQLLPYIEF